MKKTCLSQTAEIVVWIKLYQGNYFVVACEWLTMTLASTIVVLLFCSTSNLTKLPCLSMKAISVSLIQVPLYVGWGLYLLASKSGNRSFSLFKFRVNLSVRKGRYSILWVYAECSRLKLIEKNKRNDYGHLLWMSGLMIYMAKVMIEQRSRMTRIDMRVPFQLLLFMSTVGNSWKKNKKKRHLILRIRARRQNDADGERCPIAGEDKSTSGWTHWVCFDATSTHFWLPSDSPERKTFALSS